MPPSSWKKSPLDLIDRFAAALPAHPAIVRKPMFGYAAAFANGNLVCGLFRDSVVVRLGKEGASQAISEDRAEQFAPMPGRVMTGYVLVPADDALDAKALAAWLQRALEFTLTVPQKPGKVRAGKSASSGKRKRRR